MPDKYIPVITAKVRYVSPEDADYISYDLLPNLVVGETIKFSMHVVEGFITLEFYDNEGNAVSAEKCQLIDGLPDFFERYDTDTKFVLTEKIRKQGFEIGDIISEDVIVF